MVMLAAAVFVAIIQRSPIITLCLGSIGMDHVICESSCML